MKVAVFTSGGDAPGMNAAVRAVTRTLIQAGHDVLGYSEGYKGIIENNFKVLNLRSVANIIHRGGTVLKTSRCPEFETVEGRQKAFKSLSDEGVSCLIGLGGDGTFRGLEVFQKEYKNFQVVGVPCTIDNDYKYSENTIGYVTAIETAVEAIDRIRDTASSHQRTFVIEVMGRRSTKLAYEVAIAAGAESVVDLNEDKSLDLALNKIQKSIEKGKLASLIVTLEKEGDESSAANFIKNAIIDKLSIDCKSLVLGHIQRGGNPLSQDRILASRMGYLAAKHVGRASGIVVEERGVVLFRDFQSLVEVQESSSENAELLEILAN